MKFFFLIITAFWSLQTLSISQNLNTLTDVLEFSNKLKQDATNTQYEVTLRYPTMTTYFKFLTSTFLITGKVKLQESKLPLPTITEEERL